MTPTPFTAGRWPPASPTAAEPHPSKSPMIAVGCLSPFILALLGAVIGHYLAGAPGTLWGLLIGLAAGLVLAFLTTRVIGRLKEG